MNDTRIDKKEKKEHTANYIVSSFILSSRSTKKIYRLNPARIGILRYICDSMDIGKKKVLRTKLYQSQIAKHCHISRVHLSPHLKALIKKKFLCYDKKKHTYSLGMVLRIWAMPCNESLHRIDMLPFVTSERYVTNRDISNSSNLTNKTTSFSEEQKPKNAPPKEYVGLSPTAPKPSKLLEDWKSGKL